MHALTTSTKSLVLAGASTMQTFSEKKEDLTQRVDTLRAELQALYIAHQTRIASLQAEQKTWDLGLADQQAENAALQTKNSQLRDKVTWYQTKLATHWCPRTPLGRAQGRLFNALRQLAYHQGQPIERFLDFLELPNP
ncbi:MAG: hypothetical protein Q8L98_08705 [Chlamydiales bacterium]|nr:hypothetical protein [Chlamydiales bacterium]